MQLQQVWMSRDVDGRSRYAVRLFSGIMGIALLAVVLIGGGTVLIFWLNLPRELFSLLLTCGVTVLTVVLSLKVGWRSVRDATVFFLAENDRMFVLDARDLLRRGRHLLDYAQGSAETQHFLNRIAQRDRLPEEAAELLGVRTIKENHGYYTVLCRICYPNRQIVDRNYFVVRGCENEEMLLQQLERRRDAVLPERTISRMPMRILLSTIVCIGIILICVFSHPAVGMLPQVIYFPCLAGVVIAAFFIIYYVIRYRRGE